MPRNLAQELKRLPEFEPPAEGWAMVQARLQRPRAADRSIAWQYGGVAAAAMLIVVGLFWHGGSWHAAAPAQAPEQRERGASRPPIWLLVERSQQLEAILETLPSRPAVERAGTSATIDELQNSIQLVDLRLVDMTRSVPDPDGQQRLWRTRVALLDSLVNVRYAEAIRGGAIQDIDTGVI